MLNIILGWISLSMGLLFVGLLLFLAIFNKYNIPFLDYLQTNHQIFTKISRIQ